MKVFSTAFYSRTHPAALFLLLLSMFDQLQWDGDKVFSVTSPTTSSPLLKLRHRNNPNMGVIKFESPVAVASRLFGPCGSDGGKTINSNLSV